jgi:hypothetical protein
MTVIQAIELNIYTLRTLRSDESAGYIALVRTSDRIPDPSVRDTEGDDLRSAGLTMDGDDDFFMTHPTDDFRLVLCARDRYAISRVHCTKSVYA